MQLAAPVVRCAAVSPESVRWAWDGVDGATSYEVKAPAGSWRDIGDALSFTRSGLSPGENYQMDVRAANSAQFSSQVRKTCSAITRGWVVAQCDSASEVGVSWSHPTQLRNAPRRWYVATVVGVVPYRSLAPYGGSGNNFTRIGASGATYTVRVQSGEVTGNPVYSETVTVRCDTSDTNIFSLNPITPPPGPVTGFACVASSHNRLTAQWDAVAGADSYRLSTTIRAIRGPRRVVVGDQGRGAATSDSISRLSDGAVYTLRVVAYNSEGNSEAATVRCRTVNHDWLDVECSAGGVLTAGWSDPSGDDPDPSGYTATVSLSGSGVIHSYSGTNTNTQKTVALGRQYQVSLRSRNGNGGPVYTQTKTRTCPNPPTTTTTPPPRVVAAPTDFEAVCTANGISMSWDVVPSMQALSPQRKFNVEVNGEVVGVVSYNLGNLGLENIVYIWGDVVGGERYTVRVKELSKELLNFDDYVNAEWVESPWTAAITVTCPNPPVTTTPSSEPEFPIKHYASIQPPPAGYETNSCWRRVISDSENFYMCRLVETTTNYISKSSPLILTASVPDPVYGVMLVLDSSDTYEGCSTYNSNTWRCLYEGTDHWSQRTQSHATFNNYYFRAIQQLNPIGAVQCAVALAETWATGLHGSFDMTSIIDNCGEYLNS